jgi:hypothetical protein
VRHRCGTSLREGDVEGLVAAVRSLRGADAAEARARSRAAFDAGYSDAAVLPRLDAILEG